jgi:poly-gamma-glutamate synthesis protein (capsule biosynthesis protein)
MLRIDKKARLKKIVIVLLVVIAVIGAAYAVWQISRLVSNTEPATVTIPVQKPIPTPSSMTSRMLVMGDVYWGRYINDWSQASPLKYAYPFQRLSEFERDKYDAWIANMECPLTNNPKVSSKEEDNYLKFDCSPAYLPEAKKWFTAVSLANNHTDNQGAAGFVETKQHLDENDMQYFGSYDPEDYNNLCDVLSLPAHVTMSDGAVKEGRLPMVWCGYHGVFKIPTPSSIGVMSRYSSLFNVVAMPHSGAEYKPVPDEIKTTLYRALIDGGADVVLGDHPHWVQSTEAYKGKLIVYSMGNFIFDQQGALDVTRSAVVNMNVSVDAKNAPDLDKWLTLGETCGTYADECLAKAKEEGLTKLPLSYHFSVLGSRDDGKVAHRATEAEIVSIKQRMNWTTTIKGLSGYNSGE